MILLWGVPGDPPFEAVSASLVQIDAPVRLLDQRRAAQMQIDLAIAADGTLAGHITDGGEDIDLDQVGAA